MSPSSAAPPVGSGRVGESPVGSDPAPAAHGSGTRDRILDTALRLFSERGTARVSMRELADAAGVTVPGLYYHFRSKAELVGAVYTDRGLEPPAREGIKATRVGDRILEKARVSFRRLMADVDYLRLVQREAVLGDVSARRAGDEGREAWRARWRTILADSVDLAPGADLEAASDVIVTFLWGLFMEYLNECDESVIGRVDDLATVLAPALSTATGRASIRKRPGRGRSTR